MIQIKSELKRYHGYLSYNSLVFSIMVNYIPCLCDEAFNSYQLVVLFYLKTNEIKKVRVIIDFFVHIIAMCDISRGWRLYGV